MTGLERARHDAIRPRGRVGTLGMFIIDEYAYTDAEGRVTRTGDESIGGGGIFAMTAARAFLPPTHCGLLVDCGPDFPPHMAETLESLGRDMIYFRARTSPTTRAVNIYSGGAIGTGHQSFEYLSQRINLLPRDLILPPSPFASPFLPEYIHVVCNTERARLVLDDMESIRRVGLEGGLGQGWSGKLIWEPMPSSCVPAELDAAISLAPSFLIISPNLLELQTLLAISPADTSQPHHAEEAAFALYRRLQTAIPGSTPPAIIVRAGELGSFTLSSQWTGWVPPYYETADQDKVIDVTGGGNAFLGGLCAGLLLTNGDMRLSSIYASTAASFAIQQRGLPTLTTTARGELWNGDDPYERLRTVARRVQG
ncbi:hypothetical protein IAU60_000306 [Kwoniella sp. DSM 27419]